VDVAGIGETGEHSQNLDSALPHATGV